MMGAAQKWVMATVLGLALVGAVGLAKAADVTEADRGFKNFTRETAVVNEQQVRLEVRGLTLHDDEKTRLNLIGYRIKADEISGGVIDLVASYGVMKNAEIGLILPGYIESRQINGASANTGDMGDLQLYGKFRREVAERCSVGGGVELSIPTGNEDKQFSTGELAVNPFVSTRYTYGRFGVGAQLGYQFLTGDVPDVFNYGVEFFIRGSDLYALRLELNGRVFQQGGFRNNDLTLWPGIDFNLSDMITIRPTGMVGGTDIALDWGLGLGMVAKF
jgi:hypothetical protein